MSDGGGHRSSGVDPFNAFVAFAPQAAALSIGPLSGVRVAVKDNIPVSGLPFTAGHPLFANRLARADAPVVRQVRELGATIVGVTRTDAGGFGVTTPEVTNPIAPERTVGGSSGGSAAAVAAGLADIALGTDTGGSVRIPAACTGLIGFKPTRGRVSTADVWPLSPSFDHVGVIGAELDLVERAASALLGSPTLPDIARQVRIGVSQTPLAPVDAKIGAALEATVSVIATAHVEIVPVQAPDTTGLLEAHGALLLKDARNVYRDLSAAERQQLATIAQRSLTLADMLTSEAVETAHLIAARFSESVEALFRRVDVLLLPTIPCPVPVRDARRVDVAGQTVTVVQALISLTAPFNVAGSPTLAMPVRESVDGIPLSVQLVARADADMLLFAAARAFIRKLSS